MTMILNKEITPYRLLRAPESELFQKPETISLFFDSEKFDVRKPMAPFSISEKPDWTANPYQDKTWRLYYHSLYWIHGLYYVSKADPIEKDKIESRIRRIILSYVYFTNELDESTIDSALYDSIWDDHATAYRISHIAYVYSRSLHKSLTNNEAQSLWHFVFRHVETLKSYLDSEKWLYSNHTLFQIEGLIDAAMTFFDGSDRENLLKFALDHYADWINRIVISEEGTVREHAAFYHIFLMARIREFNDYIQKLIGPDYLPYIDKTLERMAAVFWTMCVDKSRVPGFGDTKFNMSIAPKHIMPFVIEPYATPMCTWLQTKGTEGQNSTGLTRYPKAGHYFIRQGRRGRELFTSFLDKPFIGPHGHVDGLSFETFWCGQSILADSGGPFKYGTQLRYRYFQKPIAHNAVIIGDGQQTYKSTIQEAHSKAGISVIKGFCQVTDKVRWVRGLLQLRNHYLVVVDLLDGDTHEGAYARYQPGIGVEVTETDDGKFNLCPTGKKQLASAQAVFIKDGFGHTNHPQVVQQPLVTVSYENSDLSLHETAYLTHADGDFTAVTPIRVPMAQHALLISVFSFGAQVDLVRQSINGQHTLTLKHPDFDKSYEVTVTDRITRGRPSGFSMAACMKEK
jgi:hypothetical protein